MTDSRAYRVYLRSGGIVEFDSDSHQICNGFVFYYLKNKVVATIEMASIVATQRSPLSRKVGF